MNLTTHVRVIRVHFVIWAACCCLAAFALLSCASLSPAEVEQESGFYYGYGIGRYSRRGGGCGPAGPHLQCPYRVGRARREPECAHRGQRGDREIVRSPQAQAHSGGPVRRRDDHRVPHQGEGMGQARGGTAVRDQGGRRAEDRDPGDELRAAAHGPPGAGGRASRSPGKRRSRVAAARNRPRLFPRVRAHRDVLPRAHLRPLDPGGPEGRLRRRGCRHHGQGPDPGRQTGRLGAARRRVGGQGRRARDLPGEDRKRRPGHPRVPDRAALPQPERPPRGGHRPGPVGPPCGGADRRGREGRGALLPLRRHRRVLLRRGAGSRRRLHRRRARPRQAGDAEGGRAPGRDIRHLHRRLSRHQRPVRDVPRRHGGR